MRTTDTSLVSFERMQVGYKHSLLFRKVLLRRDLRNLAVAGEKHEIKGSFFFLISLSYKISKVFFSPTKVSKCTFDSFLFVIF